MNGKPRMLTCSNCGQETAHVLYVLEALEDGDDLFIVRNVPMVGCRNCGQTGYTAATLHELERLQSVRREEGRRQTVDVLEFTPVPDPLFPGGAAQYRRVSRSPARRDTPRPKRAKAASARRAKA